MIRQNEEFVENKQCQDVYREVLEIHLAEEGAIVQHCRGGKDRTGYGVALIQLLLGVSEADVMHDYLLTNVYKKEKNEKACSCCFKRPIIPILFRRCAILKKLIVIFAECIGANRSLWWS